MKPTRIISGGQVGADRAALDFAIENGISHGGWCPKGGVVEDGPIPAGYMLIEHQSAHFPPRTEANVKTGDATIIFAKLPLSRGSALVQGYCERHGKPFVVLPNFPNVESDVKELEKFLGSHSVQTLNVAGSRESKLPGISEHVKNVLKQVFDSLKTTP